MTTMHRRPSCFAVFIVVPTAFLAMLGVRLLFDGGWSPQSPMFRPMLACFGCGMLVYGLGMAALLFENWPRK